MILNQALEVESRGTLSGSFPTMSNSEVLQQHAWHVKTFKFDVSKAMSTKMSPSAFEQNIVFALKVDTEWRPIKLRFSNAAIHIIQILQPERLDFF